MSKECTRPPHPHPEPGRRKPYESGTMYQILLPPCFGEGRGEVPGMWGKQYILCIEKGPIILRIRT
jgi:hypothetical protein